MLNQVVKNIFEVPHTYQVSFSLQAWAVTFLFFALMYGFGTVSYTHLDVYKRQELVEGITVENVTEKINAKIEEMEKESYRLVTMSFWGTERAVLVFKKGLKGSLL